MELPEIIERKIGALKQVYLKSVLLKAIEEARHDLEEVGRNCSPETMVLFAKILTIKQELYEDLIGEPYERSKQ